MARPIRETQIGAGKEGREFPELRNGPTTGASWRTVTRLHSSRFASFPAGVDGDGSHRRRFFGWSASFPDRSPAAAGRRPVSFVSGSSIQASRSSNR